MAPCLLALALTGCAKKEVVADNVAVINGDAISSKDFVDYLEAKNQVTVNTAQGPKLAKTVGNVGVQALRDLIDRHIILQIAKEDGVYPTDADVQKELDFRNTQAPGYENEVLTQSGFPLDKLKEDIRFDLAQERIITKGVTVTPAEVDTYIKEHAQEFMTSPKADLLVISVSDSKKVRQIDQELSKGASFQSVAVRYSEAPHARETSAVFPISDVSQMPPQLADLVAKTAPLHATAWIPSGPNFLRFYVQKKTPAGPVKMTDAMKKSLQRQLAVQRGRLTNDIEKRILDKMKTSSIDVTPAGLKRSWDVVFESMKKESDQAAPPAGGPPTGTPPTGTPSTGTPPVGATTSGAKPTGTAPSTATGGGKPK